MKPVKLFVDCSWVYRNLLLVSALSLKSYNTVYSSEQGIITAATYVQTRMDLGSALSVQDVACQYELTISSLSAKSLGLGVSAVLGRTNTLFMSE